MVLHTLTILAAALFDGPAFHNCIVGGMLLAADGRKLSKRLKNYPDPAEMLETYGADALRLYLLNSPAMKAEEMRLTEEGIKQSLRDVIIPLWSAYHFFVLYANTDGWSPDAADGRRPANRLDRWILSELQTLVHTINAEMEAYRLYRTVPAMVAFVDKLTNWYIRRSRRRFWKAEEGADNDSAYATLHRVLLTFARSLAPVLPYVTEAIYRNLAREPGAPESVHLCDMPVADESLRDPELEAQMRLAMRACALGRMLRSRHGLKIRQPLQRLLLLPPDEPGRAMLEGVSDLIADELNVKEVVLVEDEAEISEVSYKANFRALGPRFGKRTGEAAAFIGGLTPDQVRGLESGGTLEVAGGAVGIDDVEVQRRERQDVVVAVEENLAVGLDVHLTEELVAECGAREVVNRVQNMRKEAGLDVADRIRLWVEGSDTLESWVGAFSGYVAAETLARQISVGEPPAGGEASMTKEWEVNTEPCRIALASFGPGG